MKGVPGSRLPVPRGGAIWTGDQLLLWNRLSADGARAFALHSSVDGQWVGQNGSALAIDFLSRVHWCFRCRKSCLCVGPRHTS